MEELTQDGAQLARTMLMAAAQLAESMARVQAQRAWMAQSRATAQAAQAQQQIAAERDAARMIFRPLTEDRYWQNAPQLDRVVQAYMTAAPWVEDDPEMRAAVQLIEEHAAAATGQHLDNDGQARETDGGLRQHPNVAEPKGPGDLASSAIGMRKIEAQSARLQSAPAFAHPLRSSLRYVGQQTATKPQKERRLARVDQCKLGTQAAARGI